MTGLAPGVYVAYTSNTQGYVDEMLGGLPCMGGCGALAVIGTPFVATAGGSTGALNFALARGGRISGTVTDAGTAQPLGGAAIEVYDGTGRIVTFAETALNGSYTTETGLVPGAYFVTARAFPYRSATLRRRVPRRRATGTQAVAVGSPVAVAGAATTGGIHLALELGGLVSGTVTAQGSGAVLASTALRFYDAQGRLAVEGFTDSDGTYSLEGGLPTGNYFALTDSERHVDEIYDNVGCVGECSGSRAPTGTPIPVAAGVTTVGRNFALAPGSGPPGPPSGVVFLPTPTGLVIQWNEPTAGGVPTSYAIDVGLAPGATALTLAAPTTEFQVIGAPPGRYYVRVRGLNAAGSGPPSVDEVLVIGGGAMGPAVPRFATAWMLGSRLLMHWERNQYGGDVTHYLVEAGTAAGLANIATIPVSVPAFTFDGVPPGTFFLRVRAVNAAGVSGPSNEVMVVAGGAGAPPGTAVRPRRGRHRLDRRDYLVQTGRTDDRLRARSRRRSRPGQRRRGDAGTADRRSIRRRATRPVLRAGPRAQQRRQPG